MAGAPGRGEDRRARIAAQRAAEQCRAAGADRQVRRRQPGAIPFIDYGNKFTSVGASYDPKLLSGLSWAQIAADLHDPSTAVAQAVLGTANYATAALCELTGNKPASACTSAVRALQGKI